MTSLWLDRAAPIPDDALPDEDDLLDVVVVGAGLTGLATALLLARAGQQVAVVEARHVGAVTTGNTTAKLSLLQGTHLSRIRSHQSQRVATAYVDANREGMAWLLRFCDDHGVAVQRRPAATYAATQDERPDVEEEHRVASSLGLPVQWHDRLDVPFPNVGGTVLAEQAQFDPMHVLAALAEQLRVHGGTLHQGHRVRSVSRRGMPTVSLAGGETLRTENVVIATGTPILDRGLYFAKLEPQRSYALAFRGVEPPEGMYLSAGSDSRSVRDVPAEGGPLLLVGGSGHVVGRMRSAIAHYDTLRDWTQTHFPGAVETHHWSAQDYQSHDGIPYMGALPRGGGRIYVATGYEKWGMTNAVAAARTISAQMLGQKPSWATTLGRRVTGPAGVAEILKTNAGVGVAQIGGLARAVRNRLPGADAPATDPPCTVVGVCTHLGGVLRWNDAEESWDCPLHGSRFTADGEVLEGPATRPLRRRS
ncbi:FAD-dependent oxidoreductase [Nocardioides sp. LHG3406-4]|uniref:FAD-dependent oxidoreductase n=1 Tax=Nocardioides sp. LHG3406-4 TaxID=2804575 RepID=UPI003CE73D60